MGNSGPKISSCMMRMSLLTSVTTVGVNLRMALSFLLAALLFGTNGVALAPRAMASARVLSRRINALSSMILV